MKTLVFWWQLFCSFFTSRYVLQQRLLEEETANLRLRILNNNYQKTYQRWSKKITAADALVALLNERRSLDPLSKPMERAVQECSEA